MFCESLNEIQTNFAGELITVDHSENEQEIFMWNKFHDKRPRMIARCTGLQDVMAAVKYTKAKDLMFSVRGNRNIVIVNFYFNLHEIGSNVLMCSE